MSTTLSTVISVGGAVLLLTYAICVTDRDEQTRARNQRHKGPHPRTSAGPRPDREVL